MKDIIISLLGLSLVAALVVFPIVLACELSAAWLFLECFTFPFAVAFFIGAMG